MVLFSTCIPEFLGGIFTAAQIIKLNFKSEKSPRILTNEEIKKFLFGAKRLEHHLYSIWATALLSIKFHALRACFVTQLLAKGTPAAIVMKICGWRDLKTIPIVSRSCLLRQRLWGMWWSSFVTKRHYFGLQITMSTELYVDFQVLEIK